MREKIKTKQRTLAKTACTIFLLFPLLLLLPACRTTVTRGELQNAPAERSAAPIANTKNNGAVQTGIGFRSRRQFEEHYEKHGREFGSITKEEYLRQAQTLRDAQVGGDILEAKRNDGTTSRFDRGSGAFLAFNQDLTIRTYFKPNDGERYFKRQLNKEH